jgi:hypothetical protein
MNGMYGFEIPFEAPVFGAFLLFIKAQLGVTSL